VTVKLKVYKTAEK